MYTYTFCCPWISISISTWNQFGFSLAVIGAPTGCLKQHFFTVDWLENENTELREESNLRWFPRMSRPHSPSRQIQMLQTSRKHARGGRWYLHYRNKFCSKWYHHSCTQPLTQGSAWVKCWVIGPCGTWRRLLSPTDVGVNLIHKVSLKVSIIFIATASCQTEILTRPTQFYVCKSPWSDWGILGLWMGMELEILSLPSTPERFHVSEWFITGEKSEYSKDTEGWIIYRLGKIKHLLNINENIARLLSWV